MSTKDDARRALAREVQAVLIARHTPEWDYSATALDVADAIIAYLLTDAVAERAAYAMYLGRPIELDQDGGDDWGILPDEWKFEWIEGARAALEGALGVHAHGSDDLSSGGVL